jgi:hypothetical protein
MEQVVGLRTHAVPSIPLHGSTSNCTTDDIEMRVCIDEERSTEDIAIEVIDIYVQ